MFAFTFARDEHQGDRRADGNTYPKKSPDEGRNVRLLFQHARVRLITWLLEVFTLDVEDSVEATRASTSTCGHLSHENETVHWPGPSPVTPEQINEVRKATPDIGQLTSSWTIMKVSKSGWTFPC